MIKQITIKNLAILDDITLEFNDSLNILTGETGAGKSIIIDALSLVFGARASMDMIRTGTDQAKIEALLFLNENTAKKVKEITDIDVSDECIIQRVLYSNGRSVAKINGNLVPASLLASIATFLIDIHSQHENQFLLKQEYHLSLLDEYIQSFDKNFLKEYQESFNKLLELYKNKEELNQRFSSIQDIDYLNFQLNELKDVLTDDEEIQVQEEYKNLQSMEKNATIIDDVLVHLDGPQQALDQLYYALKDLAKINDNETIQSYYQRLESDYLDLKDFADSFKKQFDISNFDENRLDELQEMITKTNRLKRKYNVNHLYQLKLDIENKIQLYDNFKEEIDAIDESIIKQENICNELATKLTSIRKKYAIQLENEIQNELKNLYLEDASFKIQFNVASKLLYEGKDEIAFYLSANKGEPLMPLIKVASGGEVSRMMLGIKTVFCKLFNVSTVIFDEIDTGVSGKVATAMGKKMKEIAKVCQVLAVTHLPQVASFSDNHLYIYKLVENGRTKTQVKILDEEAKINEIARLLSGKEITNNSIQLAKDLIFSNK